MRTEAPSRLTLIVSLWLRDGDVAAFEAFERQVATIVAAHGGRLESVVRCGGRDGAPFEVHVVTWPGAAALEAYRSDPRTLALRAERDRVIARTEIWTGEHRTPYGDEVTFDERR
ncbi:MAG TPA: hypothetical protein VHH11_13575 [Gammaproteobacteria bacterium]|jgi:hypothetical protein|nr:hypothetical protein [Gammaproteobacteria bacterium]